MFSGWNENKSEKNPVGVGKAEDCFPVTEKTWNEEKIFLCFKEPYNVLIKSTSTTSGLTDTSIKPNFILAVNNAPEGFKRSFTSASASSSCYFIPPLFLTLCSCWFFYLKKKKYMYIYI